ESVRVQPNTGVPPVFFATYLTSRRSPLMPAHARVPSSFAVTSPASTKGCPGPHMTCLSTCTLQTSQVSFAVTVIFLRRVGLVGSADPTISHVTETVLQEFCVRPVAVPVTGTVGAPAGRLVIAAGLTAIEPLVPVGLPVVGHEASVKFVSVTVQFARSA